MTRDQRGSSALQARCHLKAGLWLQEKDEQINPQLFGTILHAYRNATQLDSKWYMCLSVYRVIFILSIDRSIDRSIYPSIYAYIHTHPHIHPYKHPSHT